MDKFVLQDTEERFRHRIIPTITFAAHALAAVPCRQLFSK
jgi:hypothetical protein